ncbi:metalloregulator ArsR/SmtB family transcription factor [Microbacterium sp. SSW1-49]|uniref:Metalloregulator ArsR/SmtB family transcription factor n=2 Tax=Microbacterium croceum TaxID=2851645 RepID=A0ABT0FDD2_9MICO|nr:metalloregulator ArsR/SmtB family transcription factor [Microbacterium croceum]
MTTLIDLSKIVNACQNRLVSVPTRSEASECCVPRISPSMSPEDADRVARVFKALGDPTRVRLLSLIAAGAGGEACICDLTEPVGLSQGTVSHHMKLLADAGLVTREQRGKWAYFALDVDAMDAAAAALRAL